MGDLEEREIENIEANKLEGCLSDGKKEWVLISDNEDVSVY